jgi:hypothetical protein
LRKQISIALSPSSQENIMPDPDRVPMFQPCYRIHDLVEIRNDNPRYVRSLPRFPQRKPLQGVLSWLRMLLRNRKRLRQDL